ncbi:MAG TPA: T9SS type A sorting domain-containing protein, partial [Ohtaekwangia sp.]|nr:T9SS type A sorting domain-containing protein [Ohtaekwangia sp.]
TETVTQFNGKNTTETVTIKGILPEGGTIPFQVSQNAAGRYGVWNSLEIRSYTSLSTVFDQEPPSVPMALEATDTTDVTVDLAWTASTDNSGIAGYEVFQGSSLVATVDTIIAHITGLQPSTLYTFSVRAYDIKGNRSPFSTSIQVMTKVSSTTAINFYPTLAPVFDMTNPGHWSNNPNGSGSIPSGFTGNNQHFVLTRNATLENTLTITGSNSKLIVNDNIQLVVNDALTAPVDLGNNASIVINTPTAPELATLSPTSTVTFNGTSNTIPGANYGNLALEGVSSIKNFQTGTYSINGNLQIGNDVTLNGASGNGTVINLAGDLIFQGTATMGSENERIGVNFISRGSQDLIAEQTDVEFFQLRVSDTTEVNVVSSAPRTITLGSATQGAGLVLDSGAVFNLGHHILQLEGVGAINQDNNGTGRLEVSKGTIRINSSNQVSNLYFVAGSDTVNAFHVNSASGQINIRSKMNIVEVLDINNGAVNSNGNIVLLSDANGSAWIGPIRNTGAVNGNIEFQRYFDAKGKVYRYVSTPLHNSTVANWIQYLQVTGPFTGSSNANGSASLFFYDDESGWIPFPENTSTESFTLGRGYSLYMFGGAAARKLRINGPIQQGDFTYQNLSPGVPEAGEGEGLASSGYGWNLVGNPYAAPVQWGNSGWQSSGIDDVVYIPSNQIVNNANVLTFKKWNGEVGDDDFKGIIAQGQSFWIKANDEAPSLVVTEDAKYDTARVVLQRKAPAKRYLTLALSNGTQTDKAFIHFREGSTEGIDTKDAHALSNTFFNVSTLSGNTKLSINTLPLEFCEKNLLLDIKTSKTGQYNLKFTNLNTFDFPVNVKLVDRFADAEVQLAEGSDYSFAVTNDPLSAGSTRFELVFSKPSIDASVSFSAAATAVCEENESAEVMLKGTQSGARYAIMSGSSIVKELTGSGSDMIVTLDKHALQPGINTLTLNAAFPGCDITNLSATTVINYVAKPVISATSHVLTSSSATDNQWYLEGNAIPGATGTTFMPEVSGEYTVGVSGGSCEISSDPVLFAVTAAEEAINETFTLFPNPVKSRFTIRLHAIAAGESIDVRFYNSLGQLMDKQKHIYRKEGVELNGAQLKAGVYTIVVETTRQKFERRMLKE